MLELLESLSRREIIRAVDYYFARQLAAYAEHEPAQVALAAALASIELGKGNVCVDLDSMHGQSLAGGEIVVDAPALKAALAREPGVCSNGANEDACPLVLEGDRLYLQRYWQSERRVALRLRHLAQTRFELSAESQHLMQRLFGGDSPGVEGQRQASAIALQRGLGVISGGPGTGKTTTVARLLLVLARQSREAGVSPRIALAAPTGKAAQRVSEALGREMNQLRLQAVVDEATLADLPASAQTLHRLLGAGMDGRFAFNAANPLGVDVVVLDESSMVDLRMLDALLAALPRTARLILLGDRDQLASVEAGNVFGALCSSKCTPADDAVAASIVVLRHSYRFSAQSGIGRLAETVNAGDVVALNRLLETPAPDLFRVAYGSRLESEHIALMAERYRPLLESARAGAEPQSLMRQLESFRVLCALRDGAFGVSGLNRAIELALTQAQLLAPGELFYLGQPVLIKRNDHGLRLYNGDVGLIVRGPDGELRALFQQAQGEPRYLPPMRLPEHETAFAMTVHKSQGSEFDQVLLVLPPLHGAAAPPAGRELLYTAITRARECVGLLLPQSAIDVRWLQPSLRRSGLAERLHGA